MRLIKTDGAYFAVGSHKEKGLTNPRKVDSYVPTYLAMTGDDMDMTLEDTVPNKLSMTFDRASAVSAGSFLPPALPLSPGNRKSKNRRPRRRISVMPGFRRILG